MMNQVWNLRGIYKMNSTHKVTLTEKQITAVTEFIDCWNDVQQVDQDILEEVGELLKGVVRKHKEKVLKAQSKRPKEEW